MPLTIPKYRVALDDLANEVEVEVLPGDQLRAEVEGQRRGLDNPQKQSFLLTTLWLWAACRRSGVCDKAEKFEPFVDRLVAWDRVKPEDDAAGASVGPTPEEESPNSSSSSAPASPASTGSHARTTTPPSS